MAASAMKNIDEIPEEVVEIGLDAGILQASGKRIEHVSDRTGGKSRIGQWARIGLVVERTISKELHLLKKQMGRPRLEGAFIKAVVRIGHLRSPRCAALSRPSRRQSGRRAGPDRKSGVEGKSVSVRVDFGGPRLIKKKKRTNRS